MYYEGVFRVAIFRECIERVGLGCVTGGYIDRYLHQRAKFAQFTSVAKKLKFRTIKRHFRFRKDRSVMSQTLRSMSFSFPLQASSSVVRARLRTEAPEME